MRASRSRGVKGGWNPLYACIENPPKHCLGNSAIRMHDKHVAYTHKCRRCMRMKYVLTAIGNAITNCIPDARRGTRECESGMGNTPKAEPREWRGTRKCDPRMGHTPSAEKGDSSRGNSRENEVGAHSCTHDICTRGMVSPS